ncbi:hypothetical protein GDO81_000746 [Engystomops pustulosus]|uniref:Uncharacterized protein n=1 Tax=Engystomops pustulosus TaxID=76066 RepID=A0AAV7D6U1_ENGPU|nr:hypothetical protein GDO81_000746 [Engystomops pustulosus]
MHIFPLEVSNKYTRETVMRRDWLSVPMIVPTAVHQFLWKHNTCTSDTGGGDMAGAEHKRQWNQQDGQRVASQLCTVSFCSVSEACWATVLFSWLRNFDTTSRNARLCTSLCSGSVKTATKKRI